MAVTRASNYDKAPFVRVPGRRCEAGWDAVAARLGGPVAIRPSARFHIDWWRAARSGQPGVSASPRGLTSGAPGAAALFDREPAWL